jgi:hypothetical protein
LSALIRNTWKSLAENLSILDGVVLLDGTGYDIAQLMKNAGTPK